MVQPWHQPLELVRSQQTFFRNSGSQSCKATPIHRCDNTMVQPWHQPLELAQSQQTSFHNSGSQSSKAIPIHSCHNTMVQPWHQQRELAQNQQISFHTHSSHHSSMAILPIRTMALLLVLALSGQQPQRGQSRESISCRCLLKEN